MRTTTVTDEQLEYLIELLAEQRRLKARLKEITCCELAKKMKVNYSFVYNIRIACAQEVARRARENGNESEN